MLIRWSRGVEIGIDGVALRVLMMVLLIVEVAINDCQFMTLNICAAVII